MRFFVCDDDDFIIDLSILEIIFLFFKLGIFKCKKKKKRVRKRKYINYVHIIDAKNVNIKVT